MKPAQILAHAMRRAAERHREALGPDVYRGTILSLTPLSIDLLGTDLTLDDYDVDLSQDVARYDASEGLQIGDVLALIQVGHGDWIATNVISDTPIRPVLP